MRFNKITRLLFFCTFFFVFFLVTYLFSTPDQSIHCKYESCHVEGAVFLVRVLKENKSGVHLQVIKPLFNLKKVFRDIDGYTKQFFLKRALVGAIFKKNRLSLKYYGDEYKALDGEQILIYLGSRSLITRLYHKKAIHELRYILNNKPKLQSFVSAINLLHSVDIKNRDVALDYFKKNRYKGSSGDRSYFMKELSALLEYLFKKRQLLFLNYRLDTFIRVAIEYNWDNVKERLFKTAQRVLKKNYISEVKKSDTRSAEFITSLLRHSSDDGHFFLKLKRLVLAHLDNANSRKKHDLLFALIASRAIDFDLFIKKISNEEQRKTFISACTKAKWYDYYTLSVYDNRNCYGQYQIFLDRNLSKARGIDFSNNHVLYLLVVALSLLIIIFLLFKKRVFRKK